MTAASATDPRVERSRQLICDATLDELAEVGYGAMTIESIAKRAGVGKATIYRHWNGKLDLVESALDNVKADPEVPEGDSARERITAMLHWLAGYLHDSERSACMPAMVSAAHYDDAVRTFHHRFSAERRAVMVGLRRGRHRRRRVPQSARPAAGRRDARRAAVLPPVDDPRPVPARRGRSHRRSRARLNRGLDLVVGRPTGLIAGRRAVLRRIRPFGEFWVDLCAPDLTGGWLGCAPVSSGWTCARQISPVGWGLDRIRAG